jgi:hypothetical protein
MWVVIGSTVIYLETIIVSAIITVIGMLLASAVTLFFTNRHNAKLKEWELKDKEEERNFKIKEVFINKAIETLQEIPNWVEKIYWKASKYRYDPLEEGNKMQENAREFFKEEREWYLENYIYMEETIRKVFDSFFTEALNIRDIHKFKTLTESARKVKKLTMEALNQVRLIYNNPLFDLKLENVIKKKEQEYKDAEGKN